jgi:hypothetical protein
MQCTRNANVTRLRHGYDSRRGDVGYLWTPRRINDTLHQIDRGFQDAADLSPRRGDGDPPKLAVG